MSAARRVPDSLPAWLDYAHSTHEREIELGLDRLAAVWRRMGPAGPPPRRVVTVAGTNGKGSCVAALEAVASAAGWRVGSYTSPHLLRFNERLRLAGQPASDETLCAGMARVERARGDTRLTWFEFTSLALLDRMWRGGLDLAILEVGLGGRLDAVNIIAADIVVVPSIALDHCDWLGSDRESIGAEKAGVFRPGRPVICADLDPPRSMRERARALGCPWRQRGGEFSLGRQREVWDWQGANGRGVRRLPPPSLPVESVSAALEAAALLQCWPNDAALREALSALRLPGRWQRARLGETAARLDIAHNPAAAAYLARRWAETPTLGRRYALFGALSDKDLDGMLSALSVVVDCWLMASLPGVGRAEPAASLARRAAKLGIKACRVVPDVASGLATLRGVLSARDSLLVTGSCYTVGEALACAVPGGGHAGEVTMSGDETVLG